MNDFVRDDVWQKGIRDSILAPFFYGEYAKEGRYVTMDKGRLANILQKRSAVDTVVQGRDGSAIFIEEKIVRWPGYKYSSFYLETKSCTVPGHESTGWMFYGEADYLLYCFQEERSNLDCWLVDFPKLQEWFWPREANYPYHVNSTTLNRTAGRIVPVMDVHRAIPTRRYKVSERGPMQITLDKET